MNEDYYREVSKSYEKMNKEVLSSMKRNTDRQLKILEKYDVSSGKKSSLFYNFILCYVSVCLVLIVVMFIVTWFRL